MTVGSNIKQTLATLRNIQGTLRLYSVQEQNEAAKNAYIQSLDVTSEIITDLENRVKIMEFHEPQYKGK
ncbi:DUF1657 domain-containing protein [Clostridium sp. DJ247]|uniref:DUF1657 domain-containing protein n=1 Tax=Clostridium sp. DJ247 TaxID=2726188 RepID=UPI00162ADE37|nr:DUF1657 domain-containing protein [Clostridium sp. DJ247]MBC2581897.1 DUF1657 domain-containing protein [Clostridium sp. DJ247]